MSKKQLEFGLISGSNLFTSRVLNFFRKMEIKPMFIIQTSRERSFFKRFVFRLKKYGFISTITWLISSLSLRSKTNINHYSGEYNKINIDSTNQIETVLKKFKPYFMINTSSDIIPQSALDIPQFGTIAAHPGILPEYAGLSSLHWQICDGKIPGFSVFKLDGKIDGGPIIYKKHINPEVGESFFKYRNRFMYLSSYYLALISKLILLHPHKFKIANVSNVKYYSRGLKSNETKKLFDKNWEKITNLRYL